MLNPEASECYVIYFNLKKFPADVHRLLIGACGKLFQLREVVLGGFISLVIVKLMSKAKDVAEDSKVDEDANLTALVEEN